MNLVLANQLVKVVNSVSRAILSAFVSTMGNLPLIHDASTPFTPEIATFINLLAWQGRIFDAEKMALVNKITVFGLDAILAYIVREPSYIDGKECIVLDYSKTSCVAHWVSVEIHLISPGLYLGRGFWNGKSLIFCYAVILSRHAMR